MLLEGSLIINPLGWQNPWSFSFHVQHQNSWITTSEDCAVSLVSGTVIWRTVLYGCRRSCWVQVSIPQNQIITERVHYKRLSLDLTFGDPTLHCNLHYGRVKENGSMATLQWRCGHGHGRNLRFACACLACFPFGPFSDGTAFFCMC